LGKNGNETRFSPNNLCFAAAIHPPPLYGTGPRPFDSPKSVRGGKIFPIKNDYDFIGVQKNISQPSAEFLLEGVHIEGGT